MGSHPVAHDHPAVHGMLVLGASRVFLSHLPMFHSPHDFQVLLEVGLREKGSDPAALYVQDRRQSKEPIYTWVPKPFVLSRLLSDSGERLVMEGTLYRGHFERGGNPITSERVQAEVVRVVYARRFAPADEVPGHLKYLLFGSPAEPFVAHLITRPPDFDHLLSVDLSSPLPDWNGEARLLELVGRMNSLDNRFRTGEQLEAKIDAKGMTAARLVVGREFYLETGDLAP